MSRFERHTGGCQCGAVRYEVSGTVYSLNICHCRDCQKQSGSAFGMSLVIAPDAFMLTSGNLKEFQIEAASGRSKTCAFCPECGVRIFNRTSALMSIKAGTLDDVSTLAPTGHYWTKSKQPWLNLDTDIPCHEMGGKE